MLVLALCLVKICNAQTICFKYEWGLELFYCIVWYSIIKMQAAAQCLAALYFTHFHITFVDRY